METCILVLCVVMVEVEEEEEEEGNHLFSGDIYTT